MIIFLSILATLIVSSYFFILHLFSYFERKNIPHITPKFPNGNFSKDFYNDLNMLYNKFKGDKNSPIFGAYIFTTATIFITDLDLIKNILIKDFYSFPHRGFYTNEKDDPISNHLFSMDNKNGSWKHQRTKLSPTFTSGKMKYMFPIVVNIAKELKITVDDFIRPLKDSAEVHEIEIKDLMARYTVDVIGNVAFGLNCNSLKDPNTEFHQIALEIIQNAKKNNMFSRLLKSEFKNLARLFGIRTHSIPIIRFFKFIVDNNLKLREKEKIKRNDFFQLLMELRKSDENPDGLEDSDILANAYVFFIAGFETTSTTMTFALYELACNKDIQSKARDEVNQALARHNGEMSYECIQEMVYLEQIVTETLRKYPALTMLNRYCEKDYAIPETDFIIEKGTRVGIPVMLIHMDERYYPNPEKFNPDNFSPIAVQERHSMTFLGFGDGPRNCIGLRFGRMQSKIGLATLLKNFKFDIGKKLNSPIKFFRSGLLLKSESDIWLKVEEI